MRPLHIAARGGHDDIVKHLVEKADVNIQDEDWVSTMLVQIILWRLKSLSGI